MCILLPLYASQHYALHNFISIPDLAWHGVPYVYGNTTWTKTFKIQPINFILSLFLGLVSPEIHIYIAKETGKIKTIISYNYL